MIVESLRDMYTKESPRFRARELYDKSPYEPKVQSIFKPILDIAELVREEWAKPIYINSGVRTARKQKDLRDMGYKAAMYSPHVYRCALDLDTTSEEETNQLVRICRDVAEEVNLPLRIGWRSYLRAGSTFVHIDLAPMIAAPALAEGLIPQWVHNAWNQPRAEW